MPHSIGSPRLRRDEADIGSRMTEPTPLIVHVVYRFGVGGLEKGIVNLVNRCRHRWRHAIVVTEIPPVLLAHRTPVGGFVALKGVPAISRLPALFKELAPAVVHTQSCRARAVFRLGSRRAGAVPGSMAGTCRIRRVRAAAIPIGGGSIVRCVATSPCRTISRTIRERRHSAGKFRASTTAWRPSAGRRERAPGDSGCPFVEPDHASLGTVGRMEASRIRPTRRVRLSGSGADLPAASHLRLIFVGDSAMREASGAGAAGVRTGYGSQASASTSPRSCAVSLFVPPTLAEGVSARPESIQRHRSWRRPAE
jgi:hypothetical protein